MTTINTIQEYRKHKSLHSKRSIVLHEDIVHYLGVLNVYELRLLLKVGEIVGCMFSRPFAPRRGYGGKFHLEPFIEYPREDMLVECNMLQTNWKDAVRTLKRWELMAVRIDNKTKLDRYQLLRPVVVRHRLREIVFASVSTMSRHLRKIAIPFYKDLYPGINTRHYLDLINQTESLKEYGVDVLEFNTLMAQGLIKAEWWKQTFRIYDPERHLSIDPKYFCVDWTEYLKRKNNGKY